MLTPSHLSFYGRRAFRRQLPAELLIAFGAGTTMQGQFLLARRFSPAPFETAIFYSLLHVSFFLSPYLAEQMRGRSHRPFFAIMAGLVLPAFLSAAFLDGFWGAGLSLLVGQVAFICLLEPLRSRLMAANYAPWERGRCFSWLKSAAIALYFGCAIYAARSIDTDREALHRLLPAAGLLAATGCLLFRGIRERGLNRRLATEADQPRRGFGAVYRQLFRLFRHEHDFRRYQVGFLLYGLGFMMTNSREIDVVSSRLGLPYETIVLGIYGITPFLKMLFMRRFGRLLDGRGPALLSSVGFSLLIAYPLLVLAAIGTQSAGCWLASRAVVGLAMAAIDIAWSVGPLCFGPREKAAAFSAAHIFAVGFRASIGPGIGLFLARFLGDGVFIVAALLLVLAGLHMKVLGRRVGPAAMPV